MTLVNKSPATEDAAYGTANLVPLAACAFKGLLSHASFWAVGPEGIGQ